MCVNRIVEFDCDMIHQVVREIIANAIKYTSAGKSVTVYFEPFMFTDRNAKGPDLSRPVVTVSLQDQGIGVPENVFDKFYVSSKTKTGAGEKGLGLASC